ncbi:hypothetical protein WK11_25505 [Burkholderia ubonensis]|uniref:hypothetical protein n=1 Tax=Burkholderia ubonensis TaxID=101571 RepID=UPI0007553236|nr:hypothetical protein [Burkholderia ubonensis]KVR16130.1 hypothetical protein WK11_25505 [Burkholderia ubonensis]
MRQHLKLTDPRLPENEVSWRRLIDRFLQPPTADEEVRVWAKEKISKDLMLRCYREHKKKMLVMLNNDE